MRSRSDNVIPTSTRLKELFIYVDGRLIRRSNMKLAGTQLSHYISVMVDERYYLLHKLIYCYHNDVWPEVIDHIDRDKSNNRIENLRLASKSLNEANTGLRRNNSSGYKGVAYHKAAGKWRAYLQCKHIGLFDTAEEAAKEYNKRALETYGEYAYLNEVS